MIDNNITSRYWLATKRLHVVVRNLLHIQEVPGSNLDAVANHPDVFPQSFQIIWNNF